MFLLVMSSNAEVKIEYRCSGVMQSGSNLVRTKGSAPMIQDSNSLFEFNWRTSPSTLNQLGFKYFVPGIDTCSIIFVGLIWETCLATRYSLKMLCSKPCPVPVMIVKLLCLIFCLSSFSSKIHSYVFSSQFVQLSNCMPYANRVKAAMRLNGP